jgi:hypothetical protein
MLNPKALPEEAIRLDKNASGSTNALGLAGTTNKVIGLTADTILLDLNGTRITGGGTPTLDSDLTTKSYVDTLAVGLSWKSPVKATTTADGTLATAFANGQTIDGFTLTTGDRILIKDQSAPAENGIYIVTAGAPTRATDFDAWSDVPNAAVFVEQGTANGDKGFVCTSDAGGTLNTTAITFTQFTATTAVGFATAAPGGSNIAGKVSVDTTRNAGAGSGLNIDAGGGNDGEIYINLAATSGLEITSNQLKVDNDPLRGVGIDATGVYVKKEAAGIGTGGLDFNGSGELKIDLGTASGLTLTVDGLELDPDNNRALATDNGTGQAYVIVHPAGANVGGVTYNGVSGGLQIDLGSDPGLELTADGLEAKVNASASMAKTANGLEVVVDPAGAITHNGSTGIEVNLETTNPTLKIASNELGVKLEAGDDSLVATADGLKASLTKTTFHEIGVGSSSGWTTGDLDMTIDTLAAGYTGTAYIHLQVVGGPVFRPGTGAGQVNYSSTSATNIRIVNAHTYGLAVGDFIAITYTAKAVA